MERQQFGSFEVLESDQRLDLPIEILECARIVITPDSPRIGGGAMIKEFALLIAFHRRQALGESKLRRGNSRLVLRFRLFAAVERFTQHRFHFRGSALWAHLTPRRQAVPLAVVSLATEELVVSGPDDGPQGLAFDYIVYGLRIGFEEVSIVQEKQRGAYIPSMADHRALHERRPELREFNALERFKRTRAAAGKTEPLDLSTAPALHDAIVEFDPAVHSLDDRRELKTPEAIETGEGRPKEQRPDRPRLVDPKDTELAELRARVEALEALVARLATTQNGVAK